MLLRETMVALSTCQSDCTKYVQWHRIYVILFVYLCSWSNLKVKSFENNTKLSLHIARLHHAGGESSRRQSKTDVLSSFVRHRVLPQKQCCTPRPKGALFINKLTKYRTAVLTALKAAPCRTQRWCLSEGTPALELKLPKHYVVICVQSVWFGACASNQSCKRASFWRLNPVRGRHTFLKPDLGSKAKYAQIRGIGGEAK